MVDCIASGTYLERSVAMQGWKAPTHTCTQERRSGCGRTRLVSVRECAFAPERVRVCLRCDAVRCDGEGGMEGCVRMCVRACVRVH
eukprot:5319521-Pleurochrysis_carterae.AAC.1